LRRPFVLPSLISLLLSQFRKKATFFRRTIFEPYKKQKKETSTPEASSREIFYFAQQLSENFEFDLFCQGRFFSGKKFRDIQSKNLF